MGKRWITDFSSDSVKQQSSPMTRIVFHKKTAVGNHVVFTRQTEPDTSGGEFCLPLPKRITYGQNARWAPWLDSALQAIPGVGKYVSLARGAVGSLTANLAGISTQMKGNYSLVWGGSDFLSLSLDFEWLLSSENEMSTAVSFLRQMGKCLAPDGLFEAPLSKEQIVEVYGDIFDIFKVSFEAIGALFVPYKTPASVISLQVGNFIQNNWYHLEGFNVTGGNPWLLDGVPGRLDFSMKVHSLDLPEAEDWSKGVWV